MALLEHARNNGAIIYYDVNYRSSHRNEVMKITPNLIDNLEYADIVRGSREDFEVVYKKDNPDTVYKAEIAFYCKDFIYTKRCRKHRAKRQKTTSKKNILLFKPIPLAP